MQKFFKSPGFLFLWKILACGALLAVLAGCNSENDEKQREKKDNRPPQERVLILKQRFDQLEANIDEMKRDLAIQQKRLESTREIAESIKHSLMKGGLKGYSLGNISTTDPLVLKALEKQRNQKADKKEGKSLKENAEDRILNGLLMGVFLLFVIAIFVVALRDRKAAEQPFEAQVMPDYPDGNASSTSRAADAAVENEAADEASIDDTGSYEYGELNPPPPTRDYPAKPDDEKPGAENF